ncbi:MAG: hypothetical protein ACOZQL_27380 [Myxococcota bacterium]
MFTNQRRGTAGLGSITAVALVLAGWLVSTGIFMKVYRDGGLSKMPEGGTCQVVCQSAKAKG